MMPYDTPNNVREYESYESIVNYSEKKGESREVKRLSLTDSLFCEEEITGTMTSLFYLINMVDAWAYDPLVSLKISRPDPAWTVLLTEPLGIP